MTARLNRLKQKLKTAEARQDTHSPALVFGSRKLLQQRALTLVATRTDVPRTYRLRGGRHMD